jgi:hypothetical protein
MAQATENLRRMGKLAEFFPVGGTHWESSTWWTKQQVRKLRKALKDNFKNQEEPGKGESRWTPPSADWTWVEKPSDFHDFKA